MAKRVRLAGISRSSDSVLSERWKHRRRRWFPRNDRAVTFNGASRRSRTSGAALRIALMKRPESWAAARFIQLLVAPNGAAAFLLPKPVAAVRDGGTKRQ
ncbi:hypothetical protein TUM18999_29340 [Pseudomonas tohonis]|uniref:Uncharacterized protein n=1 Tax=Pseudomonas tohonis TaxID=2725477 RepID=A0A6J4E497_9PSED|nr:hypothetical protein TUM18999_29340 [Pseudomonas tohonis]GJN54018.1 hypothetical protein TUM20286_37700 [Pseudomonas tohonis]